MRDISVAIRAAARRPWFTVSTILLVGAALAVNSALYSAVHLLMLRDLPVHDPKTLTIIEAETGRPISQATFDGLRGHPAFARLAAVVPPGNESWADRGVFVAQATADLANVLGIQPRRGAWLSDEEPDGVVIAWSLWQARFAGQVDVLGTPVEVGGRKRVLRGVMPPGFDFPLGTNVWELVPQRTGANYSRFASLTAIGRLKGATDLRTLPHGSQTLSLVPLAERYTPSGRPALFFLVTGAALVLCLTILHLIALGLAQVVRQRADAAIRLALGADRRHLVRQALAEAAIPAIGGLLFAITLTVPIQSAARHWLPPEVLRGSALTLDWPVLAFGSGLALVLLVVISSIRYAVIPWRDPREALSASGESPRGSRRTGSVVLTLQTACAVALLYLCGLAVTSLMTLQKVDLGFDPSGLVSVPLPWGDTPLDGMRARATLVDESVAALNAVPGVTSAVPTMAYPLSSFRIATTVDLPDGTTSRVELLQVGPGYFDIVGARLQSGRDFDGRDASAPPSRALVNERLAKALTRYGPLPRTVQIGGIPHEIIGVVNDVRTWSPEVEPGLQAYVSIVQRHAPALSILVRTDGDNVPLAAMASAIQSVWGGQPVRVERFQERLHRLLAPQRTRSALMSGLALAGLGLTLVALAGGLVEGVRSRRRELAVRIALGADAWRLVRSVVAEGLLIVSFGVIVGLGVGTLGSRAAGGVFYGVGALDLRAAVMVISAFVLVGMAAGARAAVMACRVAPALALKRE
jgi:putative ABC transport system permease protein